MIRLLTWLGLNPRDPRGTDWVEDPIREEPPLSVRRQALELAAVAAMVVVTVAAAVVVLA